VHHFPYPAAAALSTKKSRGSFKKDDGDGYLRLIRYIVLHARGRHHKINQGQKYDIVVLLSENRSKSRLQFYSRRRKWPITRLPLHFSDYLIQCFDASGGGSLAKKEKPHRGLLRLLKPGCMNLAACTQVLLQVCERPFKQSLHFPLSRSRYTQCCTTCSLSLSLSLSYYSLAFHHARRCSTYARTKTIISLLLLP
jgi:hypothetical protein